MNQPIKFENVQDRIVELRGERVLLDVDVAELYGVETKRINEAVKNNADKFPAGYIMDVEAEEFKELRSKFSTAKFAKTRVLPKAFTEKGMYMMATILKSKRATAATLAIIEAYLGQEKNPPPAPPGRGAGTGEEPTP
ncbi:MAG: ORF6N domain-containing protein, partial [bacterium]